MGPDFEILGPNFEILWKSWEHKTNEIYVPDRELLKENLRQHKKSVKFSINLSKFID